jgi:hypothetical protein
MSAEEDGFGDWRIMNVTSLTVAVPARYPGGPSHPAGTPVYTGTETKGPDGRPLGFHTPSSTALALSVAIKTAAGAAACREQLRFRPTTTPQGPGSGVLPEDLPRLYDCFESCMASATFAFQALEGYANEVISQHVTGRYTLRRKRPVVVDSDELERLATTDEKIASILPELLKKKTPKGTKLWEEFRALKARRDATVHLKSKDQYPHGTSALSLDDGSLFYHFLSDDPVVFPRSSVRIIRYFAPIPLPRWLVEAGERVGA